MAKWLWLESPPATNARNMAIDEWALGYAERLGAPVFRSYRSSEGGATFGYFQELSSVESMSALRPLIRRTTGGGLVPHESDWTYSVAIPTEHPWFHCRASESYERLHKALSGSLVDCGVAAELAPRTVSDGPGQCFVGAEANDVLVGGRKVAGAAQRRTKAGLMIQGSVQPVPDGLERAIWFRCFVERLSQGEGVLGPQALPVEASEACAALERDKYANLAFIARR